jgi:hypothetical protein
MPLKSDLFRGVPELENCLLHDRDHIMRGAKGDYVSRIQQALDLLGDVPIAADELAKQEFGESTENAVFAFKTKNQIINRTYQTSPDKIVGKMTLQALDDQLARRKPSPTPPAPPSPPVVDIGGAQIGHMHGNEIIADYYRNCGLETIGAGQIPTHGPRFYATLEELIDILQSRPEVHQVIVNHGNPDDGLLIPFSRETHYFQTGNIMYMLSGLADMAERGEIDPNDPKAKVLLGVASDMRVSRAVVIRVVRKLVALRKKQLILHFRACNLTDPVMVGSYKKAFGARAITYHGCRLLYLRIRPQQIKAGHTIAELEAKPITRAIRHRTFEDPIGLLWPMVIFIEDLDGHTRVRDFTLIVHRSSEQVVGWAEFLIRQWRKTDALEFVLPVMWDDKELTFHCPLEPGWRQKLNII